MFKKNIIKDTMYHNKNHKPNHEHNHEQNQDSWTVSQTMNHKPETRAWPYQPSSLV